MPVSSPTSTRLRSLALLLEPALAPGEGHHSQRIVQFLSGRAMLGIGSGLMIFAGIGVGPWDSAYVAVSRLIGWQVGNVTIGVMAVLALVAFLLGVRPSLATVASFWVSGMSINLTLAAASSFQWSGRTQPFGPALWFLLGFLVNVCGGAIYLAAGFGRSAYDSVMIALMHRTSRGFVPVRLAMEGAMFAVALFLHGPLGFGTVVYGLGVGPGIHFLLHRLPARFTSAQSISVDETV